MAPLPPPLLLPLAQAALAQVQARSLKLAPCLRPEMGRKAARARVQARSPGPVPPPRPRLRRGTGRADQGQAPLSPPCQRRETGRKAARAWARERSPGLAVLPSQWPSPVPSGQGQVPALR